MLYYASIQILPDSAEMGVCVFAYSETEVGAGAHFGQATTQNEVVFDVSHKSTKIYTKIVAKKLVLFISSW